jgi:hypothetical protein
MRPIRIEGAEPKPLNAPADWVEETHGHCQGLFVRREIAAGGLHLMRSAWEVELTEAACLYAGAALELGVAGQCHPVVQLSVGKLPAEFEPVVNARRWTTPDGHRMVRVEMIFPHAGGCRAFSNQPVSESFAVAVARGVQAVEEYARSVRWI